jgi:hypothetical protein
MSDLLGSGEGLRGAKGVRVEWKQQGEIGKKGQGSSCTARDTRRKTAPRRPPFVPQNSLEANEKSVPNCKQLSKQLPAFEWI